MRSPAQAVLHAPTPHTMLHALLAQEPAAQPCLPAHALPRLVCMQIKQGTYSLDANLTLLRFFQFQPSSIDITVLAKVLLLSLAQLPASDFKICLHLVPERLHQVRHVLSHTLQGKVLHLK